MSKEKGERGRSRFIATPAINGFSLLELMIASVLLGVISMATYSGIDGGVRIWKRVEVSVKELDLALGWKKIRKDLANYTPFRSIGFHGTDLGISFPGLVTVKGEGGQPHKEVGRVRYLFEEINHQLCREEITYAEAVRNTTGKCQPVISAVESVAFEYYGLEGSPGGVGSWQKIWDGVTPPLAIRMKIALEKVGGKVGIEQQYTATFP